MTDTSERVRTEPGTKWVRGYSNGRKVVDTRAVQLVWTHPYYPTWFFPVADVDVNFAARVAETTTTHDDLPDHLAIRWDALDHWFEEDVEVFVHPRDPYSRIDALASSRHVRVSIDGTVVAGYAQADDPLRNGDYPLGTTCHPPTFASMSSPPPIRRRPAPTRAPLRTGRPPSTAPSTLTSSGVTRPRCGSRSPSPV